MKKVVAILLTAGVLAGGYYAYTFFFQSFYPETILPSDTLLYAQVDDLEAFRDGWKDTAIGKKIANSPRKEMYGRQWNRALSLLESTSGIDLKPLQDVAGKYIAFAMIPHSVPEAGLILISHLRDEKKAKELFEQEYDAAFKRRIPDLKKDKVEYEGVTYYKYSSKEFNSKVSPSYSVDSKNLVFASSEEAMKILVDVKRGKREGLKNSDPLQDAKNNVGYKNGVFLYADGKNFVQRFRARVQSTGGRDWVVQLLGLDAVGTLSYRVGFRENGFEEVGFLSVTDNPRGLLKIYMDQEPRELHALQVVPSDSEVATAGTLPEPGKLWEQGTQEIKSVLTADQYQKWEQFTGTLRGLLDFDFHRDLFATIGNEFVFTYKTGSNPSWKSKDYLIGFSLRSKEDFQKTFDRLIGLGAVRGLIEREEAYGGMNLSVFEIRAGSVSLTPASYFNNDWFYIASDVALLKRSIESIQQKKGIRSAADFQNVTRGFPAKVNSLTYTNVHTYLASHGEILRNESLEPENRWMKEYQIDEELKYLSEGLFGSASYSRIEHNGVQWVTYSSVPSVVFVLPMVLPSLPELLLER